VSILATCFATQKHSKSLPENKEKGRRIHTHLTNLGGTGAKPNQTCEERQKMTENVYFQ